MIGAAALAEFAAGYPDTPVVIKHDLGGHPLAALPVLKTLIRQMPEGKARLWDEMTASFRPVAGTEAAQLLEGEDITGAHFRFLGIEQTEPYGAWSNEIRKYLGPLLLGTSKGLKFTSPLLTAYLPGDEAVVRTHEDHALLLALHGEQIFTIRSDLASTAYGANTADDGAEGLIMADGTKADSTGPFTIELEEGSALFLPARLPWSLRVTDGPAVALIIRWTTEDVQQREGSARWRERIGRHPSPARQPWLAGLEARFARLFGK